MTTIQVDGGHTAPPKGFNPERYGDLDSRNPIRETTENGPSAKQFTRMVYDQDQQAAVVAALWRFAEGAASAPKAATVVVNKLRDMFGIDVAKRTVEGWLYGATVPKIIVTAIFTYESALEMTPAARARLAAKWIVK